MMAQKPCHWAMAVGSSIVDVMGAIIRMSLQERHFASLELGPSDQEHINGDIKRIFDHLIREWILFMQSNSRKITPIFSLWQFVSIP